MLKDDGVELDDDRGRERLMVYCILALRERVEVYDVLSLWARTFAGLIE